jgi:hypothetical protein
MRYLLIASTRVSSYPATSFTFSYPDATAHVSIVGMRQKGLSQKPENEVR